MKRTRCTTSASKKRKKSKLRPDEVDGIRELNFIAHDETNLHRKTLEKDLSVPHAMSGCTSTGENQLEDNKTSSNGIKSKKMTLLKSCNMQDCEYFVKSKSISSDCYSEVSESLKAVSPIHPTAENLTLDSESNYVSPVATPKQVLNPSRFSTSCQRKTSISRTSLPFSDEENVFASITDNYNDHIRLPIPDPRGFDDDFQPRIGSSITKATPSTPFRSAGKYSSQEEDSSGIFRTPLKRADSLESCKILATASKVIDQFEPVHFSSDFELTDRIGMGSFAVVYKAISFDDNKAYAVKKSLKVFRGRHDRSRALQEVYALKSMSACPYVVRFDRAWQEDGYLYSQMELCELGNLSDILHALKDDIFPDASIWKVAHDASSALKHIHSAGFVHLDIKPGNIFLCSSGKFKVGDFGICTKIIESSEVDVGLEGDGRYMAKELLDNNQRLPSADIFSLGISLYELCCTVELPDCGLKWHDLRNGRAPKLPEYRENQLANVISSMMSPSNIERPTASELLEIPNIKKVGENDDPFLMDKARRRLVEFEALVPQNRQCFL